MIGVKLLGVALDQGAGSPQFTPASLDDYRIIRDNLAGAIALRKTDSCPPACSQIPR